MPCPDEGKGREEGGTGILPDEPVIIGKDTSLRAVFAQVEKVAPTESTVLVTGETGTGKEMIVRALHARSQRCKGPFVPVNCGAIPHDLIESELFGHERGAFTGALHARPGRFEVADRGTLFLDEVGEMELSLQVKLLRALQERVIERVGGTQPRKVNVRVIAATNRNLEEEVARKTFREDLYYRLSVIPIHLPPLRRRGSDILELARYFLGIYCSQNGREPLLLSDGAARMLLEYPWPGNVRELENFMNRLSILTEGPMVEPGDLPEKIHRALQSGQAGDAARVQQDQAGRAAEGAVAGGFGPVPSETSGAQGFVWPGIEELARLGMTLKDFLGCMEHNLLLEALERSQGSHQQAADCLGIKRTTLIEKLKRKGLLKA